MTATISLPAPECIPGVARQPALRLEPKRRWILFGNEPSDWATWLARFRGSVFHSPAAQALRADDSHPIYAALLERDRVAGIAIGSRSRCRLSYRDRHVYFPTMPAIAPGLDHDDMLYLLFDQLRGNGISEVTVDSFDADWVPSRADAVASRVRHEYVLPLSHGPDLRHLSSGHVRKVSRAERGRWDFQMLAPDEGERLLNLVTASAALRAELRGNQYAPMRSPSNAIRDHHHWGLTVFGAYRCGRPLAAALVGWTTRRAFYVAGGSTLEGYDCAAGVWLHWRIGLALRSWGVDAYNLGGAPAEAASDQNHPAHGLHRFKSGFGTKMVRRAGLKWVGRPFHAGMHRFIRDLAAAVAAPSFTW